RYTILSERNLALLTEYWFACGKPRDIIGTFTTLSES
ncbi:integrase, partial [[Eubacterium] rectale]|nr:integrase [Agathobacter rectalis]MSC89070.1 integrase [Agathobacter rectalis]MSD11304.1 integrase [Agathobacter rectalis]MSD19981.1 integrase [Agathobacter rectalis]MSD25246.1 integrase [Agathobacter rectalis]